MWEKINWSIVQFFKRLSKPSMNPPPIMCRPLTAIAAGILCNLHKPHFCYRFVTTCNHFATSCNQGKNLSNLPISDVLLRRTLYHGKVLERDRRLMIHPEQLLLICPSPVDSDNRRFMIRQGQLLIICLCLMCYLWLDVLWYTRNSCCLFVYHLWTSMTGGHRLSMIRTGQLLLKCAQ